MDDLYDSFSPLAPVSSSFILEIANQFPTLSSPKKTDPPHESSVLEQQTPKSSRKRRSKKTPSTDSRSRRQRAALACSCCRGRKVRCDVVRMVPCTNCYLDKQECVIPPSRKRKYVFPVKSIASHYSDAEYDLV